MIMPEEDSLDHPPSTDLGYQREEDVPLASAKNVEDAGPPPVAAEDSQYTVERLLEHRVQRLSGRHRQQIIEYLIKWEGYGNKYNY